MPKAVFPNAEGFIQLVKPDNKFQFCTRSVGRQTSYNTVEMLTRIDANKVPCDNRQMTLPGKSGDWLNLGSDSETKPSKNMIKTAYLCKNSSGELTVKLCCFIKAGTSSNWLMDLTFEYSNNLLYQLHLLEK